jgi:DNA-binding XRE family transcriptional regulator
MSAVIKIEISPTKLKQARGKVGLSHAAKTVGISRQHLWAIENGDIRPNSDVLARLCVLYDVEIGDLTRASTNGKKKAA